MASSWIETLRKAQKTSLVQDGKRKIHFTFPDKTEMVEEYSLKTGELLARRWKKKTLLGGDGKWEFEVGEDYRMPNTLIDEDHLKESNTNPVMSRKDTRTHFQWRVRNLPYPIDTYSVTADNEQRHCIVRTTNKKYYKKFSIPDLDRAALPLDQSAITLAHANNTLIVSYKKPKEILDIEEQVQRQLFNMKSTKDGDMECNPS